MKERRETDTCILCTCFEEQIGRKRARINKGEREREMKRDRAQEAGKSCLTISSTNELPNLFGLQLVFKLRFCHSFEPPRWEKKGPATYNATILVCMKHTNTYINMCVPVNMFKRYFHWTLIRITFSKLFSFVPQLNQFLIYWSSKNHLIYWSNRT